MTDGDEPCANDKRPRRLMGPWFWIALTFGLACALAGLVLARLGPKYL
jgi:uncharacterized protein involved in exopolysaccharide biosynthesis